MLPSSLQLGAIRCRHLGRVWCDAFARSGSVLSVVVRRTSPLPSVLLPWCTRAQGSRCRAVVSAWDQPGKDRSRIAREM